MLVCCRSLCSTASCLNSNPNEIPVLYIQPWSATNRPCSTKQVLLSQPHFLYSHTCWDTDKEQLNLLIQRMEKGTGGFFYWCCYEISPYWLMCSSSFWWPVHLNPDVLVIKIKLLPFPCITNPPLLLISGEGLQSPFLSFGSGGSP